MSRREETEVRPPPRFARVRPQGRRSRSGRRPRQARGQPADPVYQSRQSGGRVCHAWRRREASAQGHRGAHGVGASRSALAGGSQAQRPRPAEALGLPAGRLPDSARRRRSRRRQSQPAPRSVRLGQAERSRPRLQSAGRTRSDHPSPHARARRLPADRRRDRRLRRRQ